MPSPNPAGKNVTTWTNIAAWPGRGLWLLQHGEVHVWRGKYAQPKPATPLAVGGHFSASFALNTALQSSHIFHFLSECLELYLNLFSFQMAAPEGGKSDGDEETNMDVKCET